MGIRSLLSKPLAAWVHRDTRRWSARPVETQQKQFEALIGRARDTQFGRAHGFADVRTPADFARLVPVRDYEGLAPYVERIRAGESDVLWPGRPRYFAKTSGTTSGVKYIPITRESVPNHINSARNALLAYVHETGKSTFLDRNLIFLSGSPEMEEVNGIHVGRLSGIVNHHVPGYLRTNQRPSYATNCIDDWEEKLERVIDETLAADMSLISGIPPWVQMYFDRLRARTGGKLIKDIFPHFELFVYGGVNFAPYRKQLFESIGRRVDSIETYPASEGFIAYQNRRGDESLLMLLDAGIFYEFIPADRYFEENPPRLTIGEVELDKNYAVVMSTNAGLWGYGIGDTVKFVSKNPHKLLVTGRIKHFISAFGEHVIGEEVERALRYATQYHPEVEVVEFTVAPRVEAAEGEPGVATLPHHEWLIEFARPPANLPAFERRLDEGLRQLNIYYDDLITGSILE
ncbi:MAG: GH3 auxin-responsive promoter family protein, partial [Catalinimonas sp.]